jgi:hypothetical protein
MRDQRPAPARRASPRIDGPDLAAEQVTWLVVAAPLNRLTTGATYRPINRLDLRRERFRIRAVSKGRIRRRMRPVIPFAVIDAQ